MKLFRRRISRSAVLLFFNMVLVLVSALLVLVNMQARTELDESKRGFYSERASYLINEESGWEEIWISCWEMSGIMESYLKKIWRWKRIPEVCFIKEILKSCR